MKKKLLILTIVLSALLLTSCGFLVKSGINSAINFSGEIANVADKVLENKGDFILVDPAKSVNIEEVHEAKSIDIKKIKVDNPIGNIVVKNEDIDKIKIDIVKRIENEEATDDENKKILETIKTIIKEENDKYYLKVDADNINYGNTKLDNKRLGIDINISLPKNIELIDVDLDVGRIQVGDYKGVLITENAVGSIELMNIVGKIIASTEVGSIDGKNLILKKDSKFSTSVGGIELDIADMEDIEVDYELGSFEYTYGKEHNYIVNNKKDDNFNSNLPTIYVETELDF